MTYNGYGFYDNPDHIPGQPHHARAIKLLDIESQRSLQRHT